jgi:putative hydrolase of the HAD superfamily
MRSNEASGWHAAGAGIFCVDGRIADCLIEDNEVGAMTSSSGGGVHCQDAVIQACWIRGNHANAGEGGALGAGVAATGGSIADCRPVGGVLLQQIAPRAISWYGLRRAVAFGTPQPFQGDVGTLRHMPQRFTHVFVDATDTLLRVHGSVGQLYAPAARRHGFETSAQAVDVAFRAAMSTSPPPCFPGAPAGDLERLEKDWWRDVVRRTFQPLGAFPRFDAFFAEVFEIFRTTAAWDLLPGARDTLLALHREGRRLGIISDMDGRLLDVLEFLGLRRLFDPVVLSTRVGRCKRDGAIYAYALAAAGLLGEQAVHVGDSLRLDVLGARAAGMTPIYFQSQGDAPPGVAVVRSWPELPAVLRDLEATAP